MTQQVAANAKPEPQDTDGHEPLPQQERFYRAPARFGNTPVAREPLGWDARNPYFRNHYPEVRLPTQIVERVRMGNDEPYEPNRLIWGDNLHVMRQIPNDSVDLIYIDPPFFSGRQYNVIWGDNNELRSFNDIWEGGMDGYLIWLNARLYEMKRILKNTGSIYVHCDWHASHYIKTEMDKIFGYGNFLNEIVWSYTSGGVSKQWFGRKHDTILLYAKSLGNHCIHLPQEKSYTRTLPEPHTNSGKVLNVVRDEICDLCSSGRPGQKYRMVSMRDVWTDIRGLFRNDNEMIGYPTQKPELLLERIVLASSKHGDTIADLFNGGGTTAVVAQRLGRRFIACDQSRIAIAVTAERLKQQALTRGMADAPIPDFTVEQWGIYEAERLEEMPAEEFRSFILACYDARIPSNDAGIHGYKGARALTPVWVGPPSQRTPVTAQDVDGFAQAIISTDRYQVDETLRDGVMLAWGFSPEAAAAADEWRQNEYARIAFVRLDQVRIDSGEFRRHIASQSTERADYSEFLTFVEPPEVSFDERRLKARHYEFDAGDSSSQNADGKIISVQWDFDYNGQVFHAERRPWKQRDALKTQHTFTRVGAFTVACRIQDNKGGQAMFTKRVRVS